MIQKAARDFAQTELLPGAKPKPDMSLIYPTEPTQLPPKNSSAWSGRQDDLDRTPVCSGYSVALFLPSNGNY